MRPHACLPKRTVYDDCSQWRDDGTWTRLVAAFREQTRVAAEREPTPRAACIDSPSMKTTTIGGAECGSDGGKTITGRQRPLRVETLGLWLAVLLTSAGRDDGVAAPLLCADGTLEDLPRLVTLVAARPYHPPGPRRVDGAASRGVGHRGPGASSRHDRFHPAGATLGGGTHAGLAWSVRKQQ